METDSSTWQAEWNAGDMGCGELLIELRKKLLDMDPGSRLRLIANDPGAIEDLPSWCKMTGHTLVQFEHPVYIIARRNR